MGRKHPQINAAAPAYQLVQQLQQEEESQNEETEEQNTNEILTCVICVEPIDLPTRQFKNGNKCSHLICVDCIIRYIQYQLNDYNVGIIPCPALDCTHSLDPLTCEPVISQRLFVRWCDVLCESAISQCERRYCPHRTCNSLVVNECGESVEKCRCPNCRQDFCFKCSSVWHPGFGCGETISREDRALGHLAETLGWMRCPGCRHFVERIEGCDSILCRCGIKFCYKCGREITGVACTCFTYVQRFCSLLVWMIFVAVIMVGIAKLVSLIF